MPKLTYFFEKRKRAKHLKYLQDNIKDGMALEEIVDVFEQMCRMPATDCLYLFETGTFKTQVKINMFWFSLTRQYPGKQEEYEQLSVNVLYHPTDETAAFSKAVWDIDIGENFFDYIRNSAAYAWAKEHPISEIEISFDET